MKKTKIIYWIFTGIMVAILGLGAIFDAISAPEAVEHVTQLGYPAYLVPFLGVAKLAGILVILIPGSSRIKEWAYAGLVFDLVGAMYSHMVVGNPPATWLSFTVMFALIAGSYIYSHKLAKTDQSETHQSAPIRKPIYSAT